MKVFLISLVLVSAPFATASQFEDRQQAYAESQARQPSCGQIFYQRVLNQAHHRISVIAAKHRGLVGQPTTFGRNAVSGLEFNTGDGLSCRLHFFALAAGCYDQNHNPSRIPSPARKINGCN
jgi:hypothetical protein